MVKVFSTLNFLDIKFIIFLLLQTDNPLNTLRKGPIRPEGGRQDRTSLSITKLFIFCNNLYQAKNADGPRSLSSGRL